MILKDYHCSEHGYFEGWEERCPMKGCHGDVAVVFLQPVALKSDRTKKADRTLEGLAEEFGMTDIKSTREGDHQTGYIKRNNSQTDAERAAEAEAAAQKQPRPGDAAIWGGAGGMSLKSVVNGQFKPVADEAVSVLPKSVGNLTGPRTASYTADHENLSIQK
jgi:hypothetical protein